jgi:hypothetical protein
VKGKEGVLSEMSVAATFTSASATAADISAPGVPAMTVQTTHHERPLLIHTGGPTVRVEPGQFRDHKDAELVMLESLVGREPPFVKDGAYPANKY